jgi:hypothetical protein
MTYRSATRTLIGIGRTCVATTFANYALDGFEGFQVVHIYFPVVDAKRALLKRGTHNNICAHWNYPH